MLNFSSNYIQEQTLATQQVASVTKPDNANENLRNVNYQALNLRNINLINSQYLCLSIPNEMSFSLTQLDYLSKQLSSQSSYFNWRYLTFNRISKRHCVAEISNLQSIKSYDFNYQHPFTIKLLCELLGLCLEIVKINAEQWYLSNNIIFQMDNIYYQATSKCWYLTLLPISFSSKNNLLINRSGLDKSAYNFAAQPTNTDLAISYQAEMQTKLESFIQFCLQKLDNLLKNESKKGKFSNLFKPKQAQPYLPNLSKIYEYLNSEKWTKLIPYLAKFKAHQHEQILLPGQNLLSK